MPDRCTRVGGPASQSVREATNAPPHQAPDAALRDSSVSPTPGNRQLLAVHRPRDNGSFQRSKPAPLMTVDAAEHAAIRRHITRHDGLYGLAAYIRDRAGTGVHRGRVPVAEKTPRPKAGKLLSSASPPRVAAGRDNSAAAAPSRAPASRPIRLTRHIDYLFFPLPPPPEPPLLPPLLPRRPGTTCP